MYEPNYNEMEKNLAPPMILNVKSRKESVQYNIPELPFYAVRNYLSVYPNKSAVVHWHTDVEFIVILSGRMNYSVNGREYLLTKGRGIFVNSNQFHYGYSKDDENCEFICIIIPLSLMTPYSAIYERYVQPIIENERCSCLSIDEKNPFGLKIISDIKILNSLIENKDEEMELSIIQRVFHIWKYLYRLMKNENDAKENGNEKYIKELRNMIFFIHKYYAEKITLEEIAEAGNVCRSNCCKIFQKLLHKSPITYLTEYRIAKSLELLNNSAMNVTEIAFCCGFSSTSYYIKKFRHMMGCSPLQYKKSPVSSSDSIESVYID